MDRLTPTVIVVAVILLALTGMFLGWRARIRRTSSISAPERVPASEFEVLGVDSGLYVATTLAEQPLERIAAHGLGFRARTVVTLRTDGLAVASKGSEPFFIPRASLRAFERATWTIDKAVEPGGLVVVTWELDGTELDSYFRMDGSEVLLSVGRKLIEGSA